MAALTLDWSTAISIRYTAAENPMAVLFAVLLTGLWLGTVRLVVLSPWYFPAILAGAAGGTWLGLTWP